MIEYCSPLEPLFSIPPKPPGMESIIHHEVPNMHAITIKGLRNNVSQKHATAPSYSS